MCIYIHTHYIVCCLFSTCSGNMHDICFFMNGPGSVYTGNRTVPLMHVSQIVCFGETLCLSSPPRVLCVHVCVCVYLRNKMFISLKIFKMDTFRYQKWTLHWMEFQWLLLFVSLLFCKNTASAFVCRTTQKWTQQAGADRRRTTPLCSVVGNSKRLHRNNIIISRLCSGLCSDQGLPFFSCSHFDKHEFIYNPYVSTRTACLMYPSIFLFIGFISIASLKTDVNVD